MAGINFKGTEQIWFDGKMVPFEKAQVHVLSHVVHYGSSIFEGARCYDTPRGPAVFRLKDHSKRIYNGCKIYRIEVPFTKQQIDDAVVEVVKVNGFRSAYLRPIVFRGYGGLGVNPAGCPVHVVVAACEMGDYLAGAANGVKVQVSSWTRMAPNTFPAMAKSGANYMNSQLIKMEAIANGFVEGIALDAFGYVCEGSGENIFLVKDGKVFTPPVGASILVGITRDSIIKLIKESELELVERNIAREELYIADEVFFTGSAAEVTPIVEIDHIGIGEGKPGPVTMQLKEKFFAIINGESPDKWNWLTYVNEY
ncbi:branched-chain amino acid transaminase [bacterium]|nr:branched-chain amino acid transaminase [bacterium]